MVKHYLKILLQALVIAVVGVYLVDFPSHLLFSAPMESFPYFFAKTSLYFVYSLIMLELFALDSFWRIFWSGVIVASLWGFYYNILPLLVKGFLPFGIPLYQLKFLGMGLLGTGVAFGIVHTLAYIVGFYAGELVGRLIKE